MERRSQRDRIEWPASDEALRKHINCLTCYSQQQASSRHRAEDMIETAAIDLDLDRRQAISKALHDASDARVAWVLHRLYLRFRIQSAVYNTFESLLESHVANIDALSVYIDVMQPDDNVDALANIFSRFTHCQRELEFERSDLGRCNRGFTRYALRWLATVIVRGCGGDLHGVLELIAKSGHLGDWPSPDLSQVLAVKRDKTQTPIWGWILPSGLGKIPATGYTYDDQWFNARHRMLRFFIAVEEIYKDYARIPDEILRLDKDEMVIARRPFRG